MKKRNDSSKTGNVMEEDKEERRANGNFRAFNYLMEGDLKIMMESSTEGNEQSDFWSGQQDWNIVTWRLYESCGVCILEFEDGIVIHMLVEKRYPLSKDLLQRMLDLGLEVERESFVALDLIRHKNWLVHKQTACGKDFSNPFMVDNLPKFRGFQTHSFIGEELG
ncbi:hypothetical protein Tco_0794990 [Tanacetum coccineum]